MYKSKTPAIGKSSWKIWLKQKIFFCTTVSKFQEILTLNICDGAKQIYPKKYNCSKKRYSTNFSSSQQEVQCKKVSFIFKILPPVYLHVIKIDITQWTTICINLSKSLYQNNILSCWNGFSRNKKIYSEQIYKPLW